MIKIIRVRGRGHP